MYADYHYYKQEFYGRLIPESDWKQSAEKASDYLDSATFGRLMQGIPVQYQRNIQRCCCELAESIFSYAESALQAETNQNGLKSSETIGAYSVSYRNRSDVIAGLLNGNSAGLEDILHRIVSKHLGRTGLLYRGVD